MSQAHVGFLVSLIAKSDEAEAFLLEAHKFILEEDMTLQWFAVKFEGGPPTQLALFDTFGNDNGRTQHAQGKATAALLIKAPELLSAPPVMKPVEVLASKVNSAKLACGLKVTFAAKPDKVDAVREFLKNAQPIVEAEPDTPVWYAIELPGGNFGIIDFFPSTKGREAHLNGKVAAALFGAAAELLAGTPEVAKFDVIATKL